MTEIKSIRDVLPGPNQWGVPKVSIDELLNKTITIKEVQFINGNFGEYVAVRFTSDDFVDAYFTTGGGVVVKKLKAVQPFLPVRATVVRVRGQRGRAYLDLQ